MNEVLREILKSKQVTDGTEILPLHSAMTVEEGGVIAKVFTTVKPDVSIEVGFAYGISTLFVCDALAENQKSSKHIVIDPTQTTGWRGIGLKNISRAGYAHFVELYEERSEIALPNLLSKGTKIQAAIIDGFHTFDHTLVDFFYVNKMLDFGGIVNFDDSDWPSIRRLTGHISTYPAYEVFMTTGLDDAYAGIRTRVRRRLAKATKISAFKRDWDDASCIAFRKIAPDTRSWDWHVDF
jgi:hypothetical protein